MTKNQTPRTQRQQTARLKMFTQELGWPLPKPKTHPVISPEQAIERGVDPASLHEAADWNMRNARGGTKARRLRQASELRRCAFEARALMNVGLAVAA